MHPVDQYRRTQSLNSLKSSVPPVLRGWLYTGSFTLLTLAYLNQQINRKDTDCSLYRQISTAYVLLSEINSEE